MGALSADPVLDCVLRLLVAERVAEPVVIDPEAEAVDALEALLALEALPEALAEEALAAEALVAEAEAADEAEAEAAEVAAELALPLIADMDSTVLVDSMTSWGV